MNHLNQCITTAILKVSGEGVLQSPMTEKNLFLSDPIKWADGNRFSFHNAVLFSEYRAIDKVRH